MAAIGYGGYRSGYGKRSAEPSGSYGYAAPKCTEVKQQVCSKTPVKTPRYVNVPKCSKVPRTDCKDTTRTTTEVKCDPIEEQKCAQVPKQVCTNKSNCHHLNFPSKLFDSNLSI